MSTEIWWRLTKPVSRPVPASGPRADQDRNAARVVSAIALASVAAGAINIAAAATVGRGSTQNLAFFSVVAAAQLVWGVVAMAEAPRWWLALGAAGNLVVVAIWVVSRTAGLPVGEYAGITLPVRFPDGLATALEAVIVAGAALLVIRGHGPVRSLARSPRVAVAAAVVAAALTLAGVLAQADAFGSAPAGSGQNGTGGVNSPYAPGTSGGGTSGGGTSGGGYGY
jgi:hypothetical protein